MSNGVALPRAYLARRRARWLLLGIAVIPVLLVLLAQVAATPLAGWYTRRALRSIRGYTGGVKVVRASLLPPIYRIDGLSIIEEPGGSWHRPLLYVERMEIRPSWRKLLDGLLVADVDAFGPKVDIVEHAKRAPAERAPAEKVQRPPDLAHELQQQAPLRIDVLRVHGGAVDIEDRTRSPAPHLYLHGLQAAVEDIATRRWLSKGRPTTLVMQGTLQHTGSVWARVDAYPWKTGINFDGRAQIEHLSVADLSSLVQPTAGIEPSQGWLDVFAEFRAVDGRLDGGVKAITHNLKVKPADQGIWSHIKAWAADAALDIFSRRPAPGAPKEAATIVPIKGTVTNAQAQIWPTVLGVVRNAFVEGIDESFRNVPPSTAEKKENPVEQAANALKKQEGPPKAQPSR